MSFAFNQVLTFFNSCALYRLRWPRPRTGGVGPRAEPKAPPVGHFCPRARTWSPHHKAWLCFRLFSCEGCPLALLSSCEGAPSRSPAEGSEYAHAGKILRDRRGPW